MRSLAVGLFALALTCGTSSATGQSAPEQRETDPAPASSAKPLPEACQRELSAAQRQEAEALAALLVTAVERTVRDNAAAPIPELLMRLETSVQTVFEEAAAGPSVARAALTDARTRLTARGLFCAPPENRNAPMRTCDAVRQALDLAARAAEEADRICTASTLGGPSALSGPPPATGGGGGGGGVTHPGVGD